MSKLIEHFTDGGLLEQFRQGNRTAIMDVSKVAGNLLNNYGEFRDQDLITLFAEVLTAIGNGQEPNEAFGWKQSGKGRIPENNTMRDSDIKQTVIYLMREGKTLNQACKAVSSEENGDFLLGYKTISEICKGLSSDTAIVHESGIFPFDFGFPWRNSRQEIK